MNQTIYFEIWTKKYPLIISPCTDKEDIELGWIHIKCEAADLNQVYAREDLPLLLEDLPWMITENLKLRKDTNIPIRFTAKERLLIEKKARENWFTNLSSFIRAKVLQSA